MQFSWVYCICKMHISLYICPKGKFERILKTSDCFECKQNEVFQKKKNCTQCCHKTLATTSYYKSLKCLMVDQY